jgi:hypothetical protein
MGWRLQLPDKRHPFVAEGKHRALVRRCGVENPAGAFDEAAALKQILLEGLNRVVEILESGFDGHFLC